MKLGCKVGVAVLLSVILTSFTYAIDGIGDFKAGLELTIPQAVGAGKPAFTLNPSIAYSRSFGAFGLAAKLGNELYIADKDTTTLAGDTKIGDILYLGVTPSYSLKAGPGTLGFGLGLQFNLPLTAKEGGALIVTSAAGAYGEGYGIGLNEESKAVLSIWIDPTVTYGFEPGFGKVAFAVGTDHLTIQRQGDKFGLDVLPIYFKGGIDFNFGLGFWVKPVVKLGIGDTNSNYDSGLNGLDFDVHYTIAQKFVVGGEVDMDISSGGFDDNGLKLIPYFTAKFGAIGAYAKVEISGIGRTVTEGDAYSMKPIVGVTYSF